MQFYCTSLSYVAPPATFFLASFQLHKERDSTAELQAKLDLQQHIKGLLEAEVRRFAVCVCTCVRVYVRIVCVFVCVGVRGWVCVCVGVRV